MMNRTETERNHLDRAAALIGRTIEAPISKMLRRAVAGIGSHPGRQSDVFN